MIGAGHSPLMRKLSAPTSAPDTFKDTKWTKLDMNRSTYPDILFDMNRIESWIPLWNRIPVRSETFDEIHMYEVIEHYGRQGNYKGFFRGMRELWRILKPNGWLIGGTPRPNVSWVWGDPGHTRSFSKQSFCYLDKRMYVNIGKHPASDYQSLVHPCWWEAMKLDYTEHGGFYFALRKVTDESD